MNSMLGKRHISMDGAIQNGIDVAPITRTQISANALATIYTDIELHTRSYNVSAYGTNFECDIWLNNDIRKCNFNSGFFAMHFCFLLSDK